MTVIVIVAVAIVFAIAAGTVVVTRRLRTRVRTPGARRILVPFAGTLDRTTLEAAIRIATAENATLVAAYLLVVPLQYPEDSARREQVGVALPLLEAVEHAALRAHVPVDARIEKGRSLTHALRRLWELERFDRIVASATNFTPKELAWILTNAPYETVVLRPAPGAQAA